MPVITVNDERPNDSLVEIDPYNLDQEWLNQPRLVMYWGLQLADAKRQLMQAKAELDMVEAELQLEIRRDPVAYELPKITEEVVKATVIVQERYQRVLKKYNRVRHKVEILSGTMEALQHRKKALEDLVNLHAMSYYAEPRTPKETALRESMEEQEKRRLRKKGIRRK